MHARKNKKPNLTAEAAYENAHLVAQDLVQLIGELLFDLPAPGGAVPVAATYFVLVEVIDTLRADHLGCYGYGRPTSPHLDALATRGAVRLPAFIRSLPVSDRAVPLGGDDGPLPEAEAAAPSES